MKLIKHMIFTNINNNQKLLINSLNGLMDKIDQPTFNIITNWQNQENITPTNQQETALYKTLKSRGYLTNSYEEELSKKEEILNALRTNYANTKANNKHITFIMTYDCNFKCPYCYEKSSSSKTAVMTPELIDAAFNLAGSDLTSIGLFGGEPLLPKNRPAIEYILAKAPEKTYNITTNGYYLVEFLDILSTINISHIMVSLDGEEKTHNSRRYLEDNKPTYSKIMLGIRKCLENNIPICIRMNLDENTYDEGNALKAKLLSQFSKYESLLSFEISPMFEATAQQNNEMYSKLYDTDIEHTPEKRRQRNRLLSTFSPIVNTITSGERLRPVYSFCYAHDNGYLVDPYGNIFPCLLAIGVDQLAIGKYYPTVEFKENSIRNRNIDKIAECKECTYSLLCGGGCPIALTDYSDVFKPVCFNIKNQIHHILPMFYTAEQQRSESL